MKKLEKKPAGHPLAKGQKVRLDKDGYVRPALDGDAVYGVATVACTTNAVIDIEIA